MSGAPQADGGRETAVSLAAEAVAGGARALASAGGVDASQVVAYDLAHAAADVEAARAMLDYGRRGEVEGRLADAFVADVLAALAGRLCGREAAWGVARDWLDPVAGFLEAHRDPSALASLAAEPGPRHLGEELELAQRSFHRFAAERVRPHAARVHREDADVPDEIVAGVAELGGFGLSVPERYGGTAATGGTEGSAATRGTEGSAAIGGTEGSGGAAAMVVATEELSWGSLGIGGSLITRPEILTRALVAGGTEEQRRRWLPDLAAGRRMAAVAVTEPDHGSDVAGLTTSATPTSGGWLLDGVKMWCTFAGRAELLLVLARTDPDRAAGHRGLSLFVVEKPSFPGTSFTMAHDGASGGTLAHEGAQGGTLAGRAIDTLGYRGMHSFELAFDRWFVPGENLVGGDAGLGRGFYLQMQGFENGRLQTAGRALGVMQAAYEEAVRYTMHRRAFGSAIYDYQLTRAKLGRMAVVVQAVRQAALRTARLMDAGGGGLQASMAKIHACRAAEWVTREAMQLHGGIGYAEESPVSRLFVDARVLSIFEGADETLALRVVARHLVGEATALSPPTERARPARPSPRA